LEDTDRLLGLGNAAATRRGIGDIPNGEVMLEFLEDRGISQMTFYAPAGTSNDFSIGGLVTGDVDLALSN
ncbi:MAG: hypothetical protein AAGA32_10860, partial [Pseudomonadota bacterium]